MENSPTFLANIAPKINPNPQLNQLVSSVKNVTKQAAFAVVLQYGVILLMDLSKEGLKART